MQELSEQIELHYLRTRPFESLQIEKDKVYHYIEECVDKLEDNECNGNNKDNKDNKDNVDNNGNDKDRWFVFKFGSESDGTSLPESDIDVGVHVNFKNTRKDKEDLLYKLSQIISCNDDNESLLVKLILHARYPIIRVFDIYSHCTVNISIADRYCFERNKLIQKHINYYNSIYSEILESDQCIKKLIVFIKYWSKIRDINNAYHGYLNSFGFMLFILKFLKWFTLNKLYYHKQCNLGELLKEFFIFYVSKFDETQHSISIIDEFYDYNNYTNYIQFGDDNDNEIIFDDKYDSKCILEVIDPVNISNNITKNVGFNEYEHIKYEFCRSLEIFDNNKDDLFNKLCKSTKESVAHYDINGHIHYGTFIYSYDHHKDIRYKYDKNAHWILTKINKHKHH